MSSDCRQKPSRSASASHGKNHPGAEVNQPDIAHVKRYVASPLTEGSGLPIKYPVTSTPPCITPSASARYALALQSIMADNVVAFLLHDDSPSLLSTCTEISSLPSSPSTCVEQAGTGQSCAEYAGSPAVARGSPFSVHQRRFISANLPFGIARVAFQVVGTTHW